LPVILAKGLFEHLVFPLHAPKLHAVEEQSDYQREPVLSGDENAEQRNSCEEINRMADLRIQSVRDQLLGLCGDGEGAAQLQPSGDPEGDSKEKECETDPILMRAWAQAENQRSDNHVNRNVKPDQVALHESGKVLDLATARFGRQAFATRAAGFYKSPIFGRLPQDASSAD
jgi:hypothetical protein